jgi:hypothetical protein
MNFPPMLAGGNIPLVPFNAALDRQLQMPFPTILGTGLARTTLAPSNEILLRSPCLKCCGGFPQPSSIAQFVLVPGDVIHGRGQQLHQPNFVYSLWILRLATMASFMSYTEILLAMTALLVFGLICYALYLRYQPYVRDIPGPFLASFTDLWRMLKVHGGRFELSNQALHAKYGDLVRVGPNCISVGDPHEIRQIYGITRLFEKVGLLTPCEQWC